jgi:hypothetical protein
VRPSRWTDHDAEWEAPTPLVDGQLAPPRQGPPTAVATAAPEPPAEPYRPTRYGPGITHLGRAVLGTVSLAGVSSGITLVVHDAAVVVGAGSLLLGLVVGLYAVWTPSVYDTTLRLEDARSPRGVDGDL